MSIEPGLSDWLKLYLTPGLGSGAVRALLKRHGLPHQVLSAPPEQLLETISPATMDRLASRDLDAPIEATLEWASRPGNRILTLADTSYPRLLLEIADPPALLFCRGRTELLERRSVAVVGSRNASAQGARDASQFARALSHAGLTVVSGMALGIDASAHRGALPSEASTIAVLGTGVDVLYPKSNAGLGSEIADRGLLLSEYPLGTAALAQNFPRRNRLISGLSLGCLVVEAAPASGSLITARMAAEQGREVFAIPGSIHSPFSKGCHQLIKNGAKLVESAEDVLSERPGQSPSAVASGETTSPADSPAKVHDRLLGEMGHAPVDLETLCMRTGLAPGIVSARLLELEMRGTVAAMPGGLYQRLS